MALTRPLPASPAGRRAGGQDDWAGFALLTSAVIVRSAFFFGLSSLLALYVGTGLHGGRQLGEAALTTMLTAAGLAAIAGTGMAWVFGATALTGFALNQSFSLTVTLGQDYLPTRIGTCSGVTPGMAISIGRLATPAPGVLADATSLHLAVTVLAAFPPAGLALALRLRPPRAGSLRRRLQALCKEQQQCSSSMMPRGRGAEPG